MHPDPMNPEQLAAMQHEEDNAAQREHAVRSAERSMDLRIVCALEQAPPVRIPDDFAARVASRVPAHTVRVRAARIRARRIGFRVAAACLILLAVSMLALAPRTAHNTFYIALQWTLAGQFCLLSAWIAIPRRQ